MNLGKSDRLILVVASLFALLISHRLFFKVYEIPPGDNALELGNIHTEGTVRRRHGKSLAWGDVSGTSTLYLRDILITPKEIGATVTWGNGQSLLIEPNTMVQFDEVSNDKIQIVLYEGKVKQAQKSPTQTAPMHKIVVQKQETIKIVPYPKTARLQTLDSDLLSGNALAELKVHTDNLLQKNLVFEPITPIVDKPFNLNRITDYKIVLLTPSPSQFNAVYNSWQKFSWDYAPLDNIEYQIEISKEQNFDRLITHKTRKKELELQFQDPGRYYWRIRALQNSASIISESSYFDMTKKLNPTTIK